MAVKKSEARPVDQRAEGVTMIPIANVHPAPDNPRGDLGDLLELADSIRSLGILQPLVVVDLPPEAYDTPSFLVVIGHRRLAAAKLADLVHVPAIIRRYDDRGRLEAMLVENLQRVDLTPLEEAAAFRRLVDELGLSQRDVSERVGRSQAHVSKRLALLQLPEKARTALVEGALILEDALEVVKLAPHPAELEAAVKVFDHANWTRGGGQAWIRAQVEARLEGIQAAQKQAAARAALEAAGVKVDSVAQNRWGTPPHAAWQTLDDTVRVGSADFTAKVEALKKEHKKLAAYIEWNGEILFMVPYKQPARKESPQQKDLRQRQERLLREREERRAILGSRYDALRPIVARRLGTEARDFVVRMAPYMTTDREPDEVLGLLALDDVPESIDELAEFLADWATGEDDRPLRLAYAAALVDGCTPWIEKPARRIHAEHLLKLGLKLTAAERELVDMGAGEAASPSPPSDEAAPLSAEQEKALTTSTAPAASSASNGTRGPQQVQAGSPAGSEALTAPAQPADLELTPAPGQQQLPPGDDTEKEAPGTGEPMTGIDVPLGEEAQIGDFDEEEPDLEAQRRAAMQALLDAEPVRVPAAKDPKACRGCNCHGDCPGGCVWIEMTDLGLLCSSPSCADLAVV